MSRKKSARSQPLRVFNGYSTSPYQQTLIISRLVYDYTLHFYRL
jgi:hypothetical protein